jgi:hypothetical protein
MSRLLFAKVAGSPGLSAFNNKNNRVSCLNP